MAAVCSLDSGRNVRLSKSSSTQSASLCHKTILQTTLANCPAAGDILALLSVLGGSNKHLSRTRECSN
jgi:hypothetical protein